MRMYVRKYHNYVIGRYIICTYVDKFHANTHIHMHIRMYTATDNLFSYVSMVKTTYLHIMYINFFLIYKLPNIQDTYTPQKTLVFEVKIFANVVS